MDSVKASLANPAFSLRKADRDKAFRVLIVYDDAAAGRCGMESYQRLLSQFGQEFDFQIRLWSFEILQGTGLNELAARDAIEADAIILATHFGDELPAGIKRWMEGWIPQKRGRKAAMIALVGATAAGTRDYLKQVSADAGMDFLSREIQSEQHSRRPPWTFVPPDDGRRYEGWGLND